LKRKAEIFIADDGIMMEAIVEKAEPPKIDEAK
jgi:hypothetical protein